MNARARGACMELAAFVALSNTSLVATPVIFACCLVTLRIWWDSPCRLTVGALHAFWWEEGGGGVWEAVLSGHLICVYNKSNAISSASDLNSWHKQSVRYMPGVGLTPYPETPSVRVGYRGRVRTLPGGWVPPPSHPPGGLGAFHVV